MKRAVVILVPALLFSATCWAAGKAAPKGKEVTMTGKISCTFCNLPAPGNCSKECCLTCIKSGDPVLFTDAKGNLYILLSDEKAKPLMTPERMDLVQENIKIEGILVKRGGIQGIYVKSTK